MKSQYLPILITTLLLTACNQEDSRLVNGMICSENSECRSDYCYERVCMEKPAGPKAENGSECTRSSECVSGYCNEQKVCAERPMANFDKKAVGKDCTEHIECLTGYCHPDRNKCAPRPATDNIEFEKQENGVSCTVNQACLSGFCNPYRGVCVDEKDKDKKIPAGEDCKIGRYCENNICSKGKCAIIEREIGAPCTEDSDCNDYYCEPNSKKCAKPEPWPDGQPCFLDVDCKSGYCATESFDVHLGECATPVENVCNTNADCEKFGDNYACAKSQANASIKLCRQLEVGEPCTNHKHCMSGLCLVDSQRCGITSFGEFQCTSNKDCESKGVGLFCDTALQYCTLNDPCKDVTCAEDENCYYGKCIGDLKEGTSCTDNSKDACILNHAFICDKGSIKDIDCEKDGLGICSIVNNEVKCVGSTRSWDKCFYSLQEYNDIDTNVCTTNNKGYYNAVCNEDVNGWLVAVPVGSTSNCPGNSTCIYSTTNYYEPECK